MNTFTKRTLAITAILALTTMAQAMPTHAVPTHAASVSQLAFNRYYSQGAATHWVTTNPYIAEVNGFRFEVTLGSLVGPGQPNTRPLYGCAVYPQGLVSFNDIGDHFVWWADDCGGYTREGLQGYIYTTPPPGVATVQLYRCYRWLGTHGDHFVSWDRGCEGQRTEFSLGYALAPQ